MKWQWGCRVLFETLQFKAFSELSTAVITFQNMYKEVFRQNIISLLWVQYFSSVIMMQPCSIVTHWKWGKKGWRFAFLVTCELLTGICLTWEKKKWKVKEMLFWLVSSPFKWVFEELTQESSRFELTRESSRFCRVMGKWQIYAWYWQHLQNLNTYWQNVFGDIYFSIERFSLQYRTRYFKVKVSLLNINI